jgi:peptidoglycan-N-acetylglucosamine deacetylase
MLERASCVLCSSTAANTVVGSVQCSRNSRRDLFARVGLRAGQLLARWVKMHGLPPLRELPPAVMWRVWRMIDSRGRLPEIRRLPVTAREVGLSFDDGPTAETTPLLIGLLRRHEATATFFVTGERAIQATNLLKELVDSGHDVFSHGWQHIRYGSLHSDVLIRDLDRMETMLSRVRPTPSPYLVRLPYGSGHRDPRLHRAIRKWNPDSRIAHWDCVTRDWEFADGCEHEEELRSRCTAAAEHILTRRYIAGSILLLHEKPFDVSAPLNARVAPLLVSALLSRMSELGLRGSRIVLSRQTDRFAGL